MCRKHFFITLLFCICSISYGLVIDQSGQVNGLTEETVDVYGVLGDVTSLDINNCVMTNLNTFDHTVVNLNDSSVNYKITASGNSVVNIYSGHTSRIFGSDTSIVNIYGGNHWGRTDRINASQLNIYGGTFEDPFFQYNDDLAGLDFYVRSYQLDSIDKDEFNRTIYTVSGIWADGSELNLKLKIIHYTESTWHIVPEPATLALFGLGLIGIRKRSRV